MTDMTINESLKAIRLRLKSDITYKNGIAIYTYQNEIDHLTAIQSTISSAESDAGDLAATLLDILSKKNHISENLAEAIPIVRAALLKAGQDAQAWKERAEKEHELRLASEAKAALLENTK